MMINVQQYMRALQGKFVKLHRAYNLNFKEYSKH